MDKLLKKIEDKISSLRVQKDKEENQIEEIKQLQEVINIINENPFSLYNLDDKTANYVVQSLKLDDDFFKNVKKYKIIHETCLQFGEEAVPQINMVKEFIQETKDKLNNRKYSLADEVANHQYTINQFEEYSELYEEVSTPDKIVTKIDLLIKNIEESGLEQKNKNALKMAINEKNNKLFQKEIIKFSETTIDDISESDKQIDEINQKLEKEFNSLTLNNLIAVSNLLSSCKSEIELEKIIAEWKYSFGDESFVKIVDGLISIKTIEWLTLRDLIGDDVEKYQDDIRNMDMQLDFLERYKLDSNIVNDLENNANTADVNSTKLEQMISEYVDDPLVSPNTVLIISDSVDKDIKSIDDQETIEDVFVLIEQLKNDKVDSKVRLMALKDIEFLKPKSKGRQARIAYTRLGENIYGIINVSAKKGDNPKVWISTVNSRKKNCDIDKLRTKISDEETLDYYVTKTKDIMNKLKDRIVTVDDNKKKTNSGGVK